MKSKNLFYIFGLIVLIGIALVANPFAVNPSVEDGGFIGVPTWGYLRCELSQSETNTLPKTFGSTQISCAETGNTLIQECEVELKTPSKSEIGSKTSVRDAGYVYKVCEIGTNCDLTAGETIFVRENFFDVDKNTGTVKKIDLKSNQFVKVEYQEIGAFGGFFRDAKIVKKGEYKIYYRPYFIYRHDIYTETTGQAIPNTEDCQTNGNVNEMNYLLEDIKGGGQLSKNLPLSDALDRISIRARGKTANYVSNYAAVIPQYQLFDDDTKYCYNNKIYTVEEIELVSGKTYKVANIRSNKPKDVGCCVDGIDYYCKNFEKVPMSQSEGEACSAFDLCPLSTPRTLSDGKMVQQICNSNNICETKTISVECSTDEECFGGYCDVFLDNPSKNKCVQRSPTDFCGNGICEYSRSETADTCSKDCSTTLKSDLFFLYLGLTFLGAIVLLLLIKQIRGK